MAGSRLLTFESGQWREGGPGAPAELHAADSFLLRDGQVVALERHINRFRDAVADARAAEQDDLQGFLELALATLPDSGEWFPRFELAATGDAAVFRLWLRPAPPRGEEVILAVAPTDTRQVPWRKGPDLARMALLRTGANAGGAGEAIILSSDGVVIEGAYSSLLVWHDDAHVSVTSAAHHRIPSVTEQVVLELLQSRGVTARPMDLQLSHWEGREVWVLSALHGIRVATRVIDGPALKGNTRRRDRYQQQWEALQKPVGRPFSIEWGDSTER